MFIVVFQGGEYEFLCILCRIAVNEEVGVESAEIQIVVLRCKGLFE